MTEGDGTGHSKGSNWTRPHRINCAAFIYGGNPRMARAPSAGSVRGGGAMEGIDVTEYGWPEKIGNAIGVAILGLVFMMFVYGYTARFFQ
jgi:hypothetical protein